MNKIGHFGTPALVAGGLAVVLLVLHLAVPFGVTDFSKEINDSGTKDDAFSRGDFADGYEAVDGYGPASPGVTLGGIIMAMVAGIFLVVLGFVPMPVVAARFAGWFFGLVGAVGGFMAFSSSAYWLGVGFTTLFGAVFQNPTPDARLWIISPVLIFVGAGALLMAFFSIMRDVVATRDGLRDTASGQLRGATFAAILIAAVLILPWSIQILDGDQTRAMGVCTADESCPATTVAFSALGHSSNEVVTSTYTGAYFGGIIGIAETTADFEPGMFQGLAFAIKVLTATAWIGFLLGALATFGPLLSSAFKLPGAAKWSSLVQGLSLPMALWGVVMWLLANIYMWRPSWEDGAIFGGMPIEDNQLFIPGVFPLVTGAILAIWAVMQFKAVRALFDSAGGLERVATTSSHSFD